MNALRWVSVVLIAGGLAMVYFSVTVFSHNDNVAYANLMALIVGVATACLSSAPPRTDTTGDRPPPPGG